MKTLKSMVEFVKQQKENNTIDLAQRFINSYEHALLLSQQPNIGMFVPAVCENGVWRVLEEPKPPHTFSSENSSHYIKQWQKESKEYQQAQSKVIFKGFNHNNTERYTQVFKITNYFLEIQFYQFNNGNVEFYVTDFSIEKPQTIKNHTLEDLVKFNLEMI